MCGVTEGVANGHSWIAATRTAPKTCSVCKKTEGVARSVLTAEEIYQQCSPAVFYIEVYNAKGKMKGSGSGFFIDNKGTAVTNFHVIDGCASARITVSDTQKKYDVLGVYNYSTDEDWAVIQVDGTGFQCLEIGEGETVVGGATVYAIGSPLGLQNTISQGLISNPTRQENGMNYIQTTAAISSGSSGGALLDELGGVIGITSASYVDGQNLNLAVPMSCVNTETSNSYKELSLLEESVSINDPGQYLKDFLVQHGTGEVSYSMTYYSLEMTDTDGNDITTKYTLSYREPNAIYITKKVSSSIDSEIWANLDIVANGNIGKTAQVLYSVGNSQGSNIGEGVVEREYITKRNSLKFEAWFGDLSITQAAAESLCHGMLMTMITSADYMFADYNLPITMADFGFVY